MVQSAARNRQHNLNLEIIQSFIHTLDVHSLKREKAFTYLNKTFKVAVSYKF